MLNVERLAQEASAVQAQHRAEAKRLKERWVELLGHLVGVRVPRDALPLTWGMNTVVLLLRDGSGDAASVPVVGQMLRGRAWEVQLTAEGLAALLASAEHHHDRAQLAAADEAVCALAYLAAEELLPNQG